MKKRFVIYGCIGWCMEIIWTGLKSLIKRDVRMMGKTSIWMFPIYGLTVFLEPICSRIKQRHIVFRGGVYTICIFIVEYWTGSLLKKLLGICPWDYGKRRFSIKGLIRLDYAPAWFIAGLIFEWLYNMLNKFTKNTS
ncbi:MAG: hypothetical protein GX327_06895 [Epulopiscium sp.]|jgi:uncharacterized membrane protein|nr:hypothetical protein [Candidatus Epulonipiscium sp.]